MCGVSVWEPGCQGASDGVCSDGEEATQIMTIVKFVKSGSFSVAVDVLNFLFPVIFPHLYQ